MRCVLVRLLILAFLLLNPSSRLAADSPEGIEFFEKKIRPVLVARCYGCHSSEADQVMVRARTGQSLGTGEKPKIFTECLCALVRASSRVTQPSKTAGGVDRPEEIPGEFPRNHQVTKHAKLH